MKKKLPILLVVVLVVLGGVYKMVLAKPAEAIKLKVDGQVYVLPKEFLVNLSDGRFAKFNVALVLDHEQAIVAEGEETSPPEGFGTLAQEAVIRDIVTDTVTDTSADELVAREGRHKVKETLLKAIKANTDVKVEEVLLTDMAVQ